ncbi:MAG: hypothetical protein JL50_02180 [Peptococcaceae bacterium BICA1-7]|nr:MAG: hypothetical protein JL50_02180 [Peptococcaceae bacterium BICA1-7]HBV95435.1 hypothetical protein [Desulfotomaculum sp.]
MNSNKENSSSSYPLEGGKAPLSDRFGNPIIKVSIRGGIICNRIEKFWTEQTIIIKSTPSDHSAKPVLPL